jgi:hypothetical protein
MRAEEIGTNAPIPQTFEPIVSHVYRDDKPLLTALISFDPDRGYLVESLDVIAEVQELLWRVGTLEEARSRADAYLEGYARGYDDASVSNDANET